MFLHSISNAVVSTRTFETLFSKISSRGRNEGLVEHRECWGDDFPNTTFYVIRRPNLWGIMSILAVYINHIYYALRRGYIPVIDQSTVQNLYLEEGEIGTGVNTWEYYFEQPAGFTLEEIAHAKNVVLSGMLLWSSDKNSYRIKHANVSAPYGDHWQGVAHAHYRLNDATKKHILRIREEVLGDGDEPILGVYCRGTDYVDSRPKGHPIQPSAETVIQKAHEVMSERGYSSLYLVTEDERVLEKFESEWGNKLRFIDAARYGSAQKGEGDFIWQRTNPRNESKYISGLNYLTGMSLLLECDGIIAGITGGTAGLRLLQHRPFNYQHYWDLGTYD